jgi:hypothetical protein
MKPKNAFLGVLLLYCLNATALEVDMTIHFDKDSFEIPDSTRKKLEVWGLSHYHVRHNKIFLYAHTDTDAESDYNITLSKNRNETVRAILVRCGFDNIVHEHFGESKPTCHEPDEACMARNRRVEVILLDSPYELWQDQANLPKPEIQEIKCDRQNVIQFDQGTIIEVPPFAFMDAEGNQVQNATLEVREFYTIKDCLEGNISTKCGDKILESGGMIEVRAFDGNKELSLAPGQSINVAFNNNAQLQPGMEVFYGRVENGVMTWDDEKTFNERRKQNQADNTQMSGLVPMEQNAFYKVGNIVTLPGLGFENAMLYIDEKNQKRVKHLLNQPYERLTKAEQNELKTIARESQRRLNVKLANDFKEIQAEYKRQMRLLEEQSKKDAKLAKKYNDEMAILTTDFEESRRQWAIKDSLLQIMNAPLQAKGLGWINCDRFIYSSVPMRSLDVIADGVRFEPSYDVMFSATLIFTDIYSVMSAQRTSNNMISFNNIPVDKERIFIYRKLRPDQKMDFAMVNIRPGEVQVKIDKIEVLTIDEVASRMNKLSARNS